MAPENAVAQDLVLDLASFELIRAGKRVKSFELAVDEKEVDETVEKLLKAK